MNGAAGTLPDKERRFTYADYKAWELDEDERFGLIDGVAHAMAAPADFHQVREYWVAKGRCMVPEFRANTARRGSAVVTPRASAANLRVKTKRLYPAVSAAMVM